MILDLPPELAANPHYEILRELGRGGMGVVYLAQNKLMDRLEVLKVVNKTLLARPGTVERFLREIRSAAKLSHPNIVAAYSAVQQDGLLAFAMEYIEGQDLTSVVKAQGPLPIANACYYVQQAALGLQHAFEKGMVHRDIKPQNLILTRKGKKHLVKVLDFGLAKLMREKSEDSGLTGEGQMLGTPDYIAPEQSLDAARADIRADIYSLGCTLYYLLAGRPPFSATSLTGILMAHQLQEAKPLNLVRPEVPEELAAVVRKMMAKDPAKRYQTPADVVQALGLCVKKASGAALAPRESDLGALTRLRSPEVSSGTMEAQPADTKAARVDPPLLPVAEAKKQQPEPAAVRESLTEGSIVPLGRHRSGVARQRRAATVRERRSLKKWPIGGGIGVGVLMVLVAMWANGVFESGAPDLAVDGAKLTTGKEVPAATVEVKKPPPKIEKREPRKLFKVGRVFSGKWIVVGDLLEQTSFAPNARLDFGDPNWTDYDFAVEAMQVQGNDQVCQLFRVKAGEGAFLYGLSWVRNTLFTIEKQRPGSIQMFGRRNGHLDQGKWYKMLVRVRGKHMQCYLNGTKIFDFQDNEHPSGCVGLRTWTTRYRFHNIKVTAPDGTVLLEGLPDLNHELP